MERHKSPQHPLKHTHSTLTPNTHTHNASGQQSVTSLHNTHKLTHTLNICFTTHNLTHPTASTPPHMGGGERHKSSQHPLTQCTLSTLTTPLGSTLHTLTVIDCTQRLQSERHKSSTTPSQTTQLSTLTTHTILTLIHTQRLHITGASQVASQHPLTHTLSNTLNTHNSHQFHTHSQRLCTERHKSLQHPLTAHSQHNLSSHTHNTPHSLHNTQTSQVSQKH